MQPVETKLKKLSWRQCFVSVILKNSHDAHEGLPALRKPCNIRTRAKSKQRSLHVGALRKETAEQPLGDFIYLGAGLCSEY